MTPSVPVDVDSETDVREQRFATHTLQLAIQTALDVASHIVSDRLDDLMRFVAAIRHRLPGGLDD